MPQGDTEACGLVINELLCFVVNKTDCLPPESICQLCLNTFKEKEIEEAKKMLYDLCSDESTARMIVRKGQKKTAQNMDDIVKFIHDKGSDLPTFVALNLQALPPVTFNSLDVSSLLHTIKQTQAEVSLLKEGLAEQAQTIRDLQSVVRNQTNTEVRSCGASTGETAATPEAAEAQADETPASAGGPGPLCSLETAASAGPGGASGASCSGERQPSVDTQQTYAAKAEEWKKIEKVKGKLKAVTTNSSAKRYVSGCSKGSGLKTVKKVVKAKYASVFASRFDTTVSSEMLKSYLEERLNLKVQVDSVKTRYDTYHSFHIISECENPKVFMEESVWPEGAYVRWWKGSRGEGMVPHLKTSSLEVTKQALLG